MRVLKQAIQWFLPSELKDNSSERQARRAIVFGFAMLIWTPVFSPIYYTLGSARGSMFIIVAAVLILASMISMRFTKSVSVTGHLIAGVVLATLLALATVTGGTGSPSLWWLPAVPIIGLLLCGVHAGIGWVIISCFGCLAFLIIDNLGIVIPEEIAQDKLRLLNVAATTGIILCAFSLTLAFKLGEDAARLDLEAAQLESEQANQAKSTFLANMSHEIRTPMNAMLGLTELLLDSRITPTQHDYLSTVLESGESLLTIVNEILDFSKIEAGKISLDSVPINLRKEIGNMMKTLAPRAHGKKLELTWHVDDDVPEVVEGDALRIRQVLLNLVGNAIKFTESGEVVVSIQRQASDDETVEIRFQISDTGVGIPRERRDQIFEEFQQADPTITRKFGGTGLGLTISSRLVDLMGGRIGVESEVGRGSKFFFTVPFRRSTAHDVHGSEPDPQLLRGVSVLIADDNSTGIGILKEMVENWGMISFTAQSTQQAMETWRQLTRDGQPPSLVLSNVDVPSEDGLALASQIRECESNFETPIILLNSGHDCCVDNRDEELKITAELSKPVRPSELLHAMLLACVPETITTEQEIPDEIDLPNDASETRGMRVLLAEDGISNQRLASLLLEKWGHTVTIAENGLVAVNLWETEMFDLILMDLQMPELDGIGATKMIRAGEEKRGGHIPIVALTAHAFDSDRDQCLAAGMDGFLSKPLRQQELRDLLDEWCGKQVRSSSR